MPWVGVMAAGYALGALLGRPDRRQWTLGLGVALTLAFFALRALNGYGNGGAGLPAPVPSTAGPWRVQPRPTLTVAAFFNALKYPPSLDYLLMTLGPALILLTWLEGATTGRGFGRILLAFGRVPLFYYVLHLFVIHGLAIVVGWLYHQPITWLWQGRFMTQDPPAGYGHGLAFIYLMWLLALGLLYFPCRWYAAFKGAHPNWGWLSYL